MKRKGKNGRRKKKKGGRRRNGGATGQQDQPGSMAGALRKLLPVIRFPDVASGITGNSNLPYSVSTTLNGRRCVTYMFEMPLAVITTDSGGTFQGYFELLPANLPKWATYMGGGTPLFGLGRLVATRMVYVPIVGVTTTGRVAGWWDYSAAAPGTALTITQIMNKQGYKLCAPYDKPGRGGIVLPWRPTNITDENWIEVTDTVFKPNGDVDSFFYAGDGCPAEADLGYIYVQYALQFQETVN